MGFQRSFWWKVRRAEEHLAELNDEIARYSEPRQCSISRDLEADSDTDWFCYRAHLSLQPGPRLAIIIGDIANNLRAALDHLAVALAPGNRKRSASFPIFTENIWERDTSGNELDRFKIQRTSFDSKTKGMPVAAIAIIRKMQPCSHPTPHLNVLTLLSAINNADKHVQLTTIANGLTNFEIRVRPSASSQWYRTESYSTVIEDGEIATRFHRLALPDSGAPAIVDSEMKVEILGGCEVAIKLAGHKGTFSVVGLFEEMIRVIVEGAFGGLESLIPTQS